MTGSAQTGHEDEDSQRGYPAALPHCFEKTGLEAADPDLSNEEVVVEAHLKGERHAHARGGQADEEQAPPTVSR